MRTSSIVWMAGLYRDSSYSSSAPVFCLSLFRVSLSPGICAHDVRAEVRRRWQKTHPSNADAKVKKTIDRVLIRARQPGMLEQASTIFVGDAVAELNVRRDDAHLRRITDQ